MQNFGEKVSFIWSVADLIRDSFKRGKYQDVILPFTVLRRLDCVLEPTKEKVLEAYHKYHGQLENLDPILCKQSGFAFYNASNYDFGKLIDDPKDLGANLKKYINSFSSNMREVLEKFDFPNTIDKLEEADLLFQVMEKFNNLANPPYGKDWKRDKSEVIKEAEKVGSRFSAGTPRISDGQLLFLQQMLSRMKSPESEGSRVAIVMNGSPLFTGDAGSGESEIRRWILENDWLEAIIALPEQLFYNTGIATYIWVLSNKKSPQRKGKVQLISGSDFWVAMRKSLGDKRREISREHIEKITDIFQGFEASEVSKIFKSTDFGYRKITIERPLRLNFQVTPERIERVKEQTAFINLAVSKKKNPETKKIEEDAGREQQKLILGVLLSLSDELYKDRKPFELLLKKAFKVENVAVKAALLKAILTGLSEKDETAEICRDKNGNPEPDTDLRDTENVPLAEDINDYFEREVKPHVPDAWINETVRDGKDNEVGKVGYEINFNRYFYQYQPPRELEEIEKDIQQVEGEILAMLQEMRG